MITNYHAFQLKDAKEIKGVAKNTRLLLKGDRKDDPFKETPQAMVSRVLRDLGAGQAADHGAQRRGTPLLRGQAAPGRREGDKEQKDANEQARVWFSGLQAIAKHAGIKQIWDLSATPFYLKGSGYNEGYIFPWTVSDFSLMDAIESGIVKVPRTPVDDDATDRARHLPAAVGLRRRRASQARREGHGQGLAPAQGARRRACAASTAATRRRSRTGRRSSQQYGETPPVFIVVCPNTVVSKLVYDWIAGEQVVEDDEIVAHKPGNLALLSNVVDGKPLARPRTILIDSAQLESGEGMKDDFKKAAGAEIAAFKQEYRRRNPGADVEKITDEELLREVMNTVGKKGKLGEQVRCVVSVSMLTEGWDANTVTHILGVRAFGSQLLCEQVVGRGLRRRSYAVNDEGHLRAEYANVYGIPFQFISSDKPIKDPLPPKPADRGPRRRRPRGAADRVPQARRLPRRAPRRRHLARPRRRARCSRSVRTRCRAGSRWAASSASDELEEGDPTQYRPQEVAFALAKRILDANFNTVDDRRPWLFPRLVEMCREWIEQKVVADRWLQPRLPDDDHGGAGARSRAGLERDHPPGRQPPRATAPDDQPLRPRGLDRRRRLPDPQAHRADGEVRGLPRHPRRQGRQHLGAAARARARAEQEREVLREERPPRLHDPVRPQGAEPLATSRTSSSGSKPGDDGGRAHPDRRGLRQPEEPRADPARRRPPRATPGASRSTTTAASAAGATSR